MLYDSSIVGSLIPVPALALSRVSPMAPDAVRATYDDRASRRQIGAEVLVVLDARAHRGKHLRPEHLVLRRDAEVVAGFAAVVSASLFSWVARSPSQSAMSVSR